MLVESQSKYDPDVIEFEKLKVRVIFEETGAEEQLKQFIINKPYFKKYHNWEENRQMKHFFAQ